MKNLQIFFIYILFFASYSFAIEEDKQLHFIIPFFIGYSTESIIHKRDFSETEKVLYSSGIALIPAIYKEISDEREENNNFDTEDLAYGALGAVTGSLLANYLNNHFFMVVEKKENIYAFQIGYCF
ncbi:MAG: hypothetical protein V3S80_00085 [Sulfurimonadaceae bacterium]